MTGPGPQGDVGFRLAQALLGHMLIRLEEAGCSPARSFVADGATVPAEDPCGGVAWTRVAAITPTDGDGNPYAEMRNAPQGPSGHMVTIECGVLRCTPILDEQGQSPDPAEYTAQALINASDRFAVRRAVLFDFPANIIAENADGQIPSDWAVIETGDLGGGFMQTRVGTTMVL